MRSALAINFSVRKWEPWYAWRILGTFTRAREVVVERDRFFFEVTSEEAGKLFPQGVPPAYAIYGKGVYFTPSFHEFGPMCRAAMIVHESVHVIDPQSGAPDVHISEWMEPAFSRQTAAQSLHNPSAYASFAAQIYEGKLDWPPGVRYGAGRPHD